MNIARVEGRFIVCSETVGVAAYDFDLELHFACDHPYRNDGEESCILRVGPIPDYQETYDDYLERGLRLVNTPEQHPLASELEHWYLLIETFTPRTLVFTSLPTADEIEEHFV